MVYDEYDVLYDTIYGARRDDDWFGVAGDLDDFIFYGEDDAQSER